MFLYPKRNEFVKSALQYKEMGFLIGQVGQDVAAARLYIICLWIFP